MSRSCQSGMPSITGVTYARTTRASPQIRSERIGFFLCGIADEPFCPAPNGSASSRTSVRWPCRTSSAIASHTVAMTASADTHSAMPSRITTWVATSAGRSPSAGATARLDRRVDVGVGADRAGDLATATASRARRSRSRERAIANAKSATRCPHTSGSAWMPCVRPDPQRVPVRQAVVAQRRDQRVRLGQQQVGRLDELQRERGVEQVGGGHAEVHVGRGLARLGVVGPGGEERDHVVLGDRLDLGDRLRGRRRRGAHRLDRRWPAPCRPRRAPRARALDPAPQLVLVRLAPDPAHLRQRVALDHGPSLPACRVAAGARRLGQTDSPRIAPTRGLP